jgi:hypothetical protein
MPSREREREHAVSRRLASEAGSDLPPEAILGFFPVEYSRVPYSSQLWIITEASLIIRFLETVNRSSTRYRFVGLQRTPYVETGRKSMLHVGILALVVLSAGHWVERHNVFAPLHLRTATW